MIGRKQKLSTVRMVMAASQTFWFLRKIEKGLRISQYPSFEGIYMPGRWKSGSPKRERWPQGIASLTQGIASLTLRVMMERRISTRADDIFCFVVG